MIAHVMALVVLLTVSASVAGADSQPRSKGIESKGYVWNEMRGEKLLALRAKGDVQRGEIAFEVCQGCHRSGALGRSDGSYPRLAGQHASVLIKQMTDVRAGRRDNPKMFPFANQHVVTTQEVADIAAFLQSLPSPADNGKGDGREIEKGRASYEADCSNCHGDNGEGNADKFYPRLAGQHYEYLVRQAVAIRDGERRNANPRMVKAVKRYSDTDLQAVSDYISRFDGTAK